MPMIHRVMKLTFLILVPVIILIATFSYNVLNIFTDDAALIRHAQGALYVLLSSYVFSISEFVYSIPISSLAYFYMRRGFWRKKAAI